MRLTLRTMLAYLDDVLEPADAEVLGKKIDESDFAAGLVQRIRSVTRKLRMDAPKLDGKGMGNDPNTVSEYLDSSLPQDRVGDFERVCLESDKHLSEVAACHQILTLVLGKPADVSLELRERVYALGDPNAAVPPIPSDIEADADRDVEAPPVAGANGKPVERAPLVVPDYLRAGRRAGVWPMLAAVAIALLVCLGLLRLLGPFDDRHPVARLLFGEPRQVAQADADLQPPDVVVAPAEPGDVNPPTGADGDAAEEGTTPADPAISETDAAPAVDPRVDAPELPDTEPVDRAPDAATTAKLPTDSDTVPADTIPADTVPADTAPATTDTPAGDAPPTPMPSPDATADAAAIPPPPPVPADDAPVGPMDVGRYTSDAQVLASLDEDTGLWHAKEPRAVLTAGERLVVVPPYRPQIALPSGVQVTFSGESAIQMGRPGESGASRMTVDWGRFMVVTVGAAGAQIDLKLAGIEGVLTLIDADAAAAIKVSRWLPPGTDPEGEEGGSLPVVEIYNAHGRVAWQERGQEKVSIPTNHVRAYVGADPAEMLGPFVAPEWIDAKSIPPIDRQASIVLEGMLDPAKPLNLSLQEAMQDRRVEVRALAARCLAFVGIFEPLINELSDSRQYSFWTPQVESLKQAVAAGPASAAAVRETIERLRSGHDRELYRLLWGYSQEQLEKGGAAVLVKHLESDQMDIRVLAISNLIAITGAQEFYRPERQPQMLRAAIANWKGRLEKGTITYRSPPSPLQDYKPLAAPPAAADARTGSPIPPLGPAPEDL